MTTVGETCDNRIDARRTGGVPEGDPLVSVVIAAYNEAEGIADTVRRIARHLHEKHTYEIVVVDDGSVDATLEILQRLQRQYPCLHVIQNGVNRGKGYAVKQGMLAARGQLILSTDADMAYSIEDLEEFLLAIQQDIDVVMGSRVHPGSMYSMNPRYFPYIFQRHLIGRMLIVIVNALFGLHVCDTQCGFKLFRAEAAREIFSRTRMTDFSFDVEACCIARRLGYRIGEMPVHFRYNGGKSSVRLIASSFRMMLDLIRIRWNLSRGIYDSPRAQEAVL